MIQSASQRLGEIDALQRFMQHLLHADGGCPVLEGRAPVPAHQDDRHIGPQQSDLASEFSTHYFRHRLIGKHCIEALKVPPKGLQRCSA